MPGVLIEVILENAREVVSSGLRELITSSITSVGLFHLHSVTW